MNTEQSPEERLLRHIRKKPDAPVDKKGAPSPAQVPPTSCKNFLKSLSAVLLIITAALLAFIGYELALGAGDVNRLAAAPATRPVPKTKPVAAFNEPKPFEHYAQRIGSRDIFATPLTQGTQTAVTPSSAPELTAHLQLVGIVLDDVAEAVVEDRSVQQTFFLHIGDEIRNAVVEDIQESKVILNYDGQIVELIQ